jgi:hypothetical protein
MDVQFEATLIECLSAFESGESLERILSRYPEDSLGLRPLLEIAASLPSLRIEPSRTAQATSRRVFLVQAQALPATPERRFQLLPIRLSAILAALLLVFVCVGSVVAASSAALPGDRLYDTKRRVETMRLWLAPVAEKDALAEQFKQERRNEVSGLLKTRREADVTFYGSIESIGPNLWQVAGLAVHVDAKTRIIGVPLIGGNAQISGWTADGRVLAASIWVDPGGAPKVIPAFTPTPVPTDSPTTRPNPTVTRTFTPMPVPTDAPAPTNIPPAKPRTTVELRPTPIATAIPAPTNTPVPPGNDNDIVDENGDPTSTDDHGGDPNGTDDHGGDPTSTDDHGGDPNGTDGSGSHNDRGGDGGGDHSDTRDSGR